MDSLWNAYVTWQEHTVKCTVQISTHKTARSFGQFGQMVECSFKNWVILGVSPIAVNSPSNFAPAWSQEFLDVQATIKYGFTLKRVREMTRTYSRMHRTDKYSERSSIIWPVFPNGRVFVLKLSGSEFESSCSHFTFRFHASFEQGVPWHSGNYRLWIHSEALTWHNKNLQSNTPYR